MADPPIISVRGLTYWYPETTRPALEDVDLEVPRGQFVLVVGESGSGKSTLLRALNGLVPRYHGGRYAGSVEVAGLQVGRRPVSELASRVGLVFQDPERQAVMSRVDNEVAFGLESLGIPAPDIPGRVDGALEAVGLSDRSVDMVSELSSGQAQRLALASVLAMEPDVLVLDEPTSQLDPVASSEFFDYLERERARRGATVVLAEHRLERGLQLADRVIALEGGAVVFDGDPGGFVRMRCEGDVKATLTTVEEVICGLPDPPSDVMGTLERLATLIRAGDLEVMKARRDGFGGPIIKCEGLRFEYEPGVEVLRGVDLELRRGEVLALVGPNGAGKTTLARHLNGLLRPRDGRLIVGGEDASDRSVTELARLVALLTQNPGDYLFQRTVGSELELTATYRDLPEGEAANEIASAIGELGLEGVLDRFSWDLSAGQRQRVALGALLVGAPEVLVLDEPTRGMDGGHKARLAALVRDLASRGRSVMVITHDMEFAARCADTYAALEDGRVVASGPPEEVLPQRPGYAPILWRLAEGMGLPPEGRPLSPMDLVTAAAAAGGGVGW